ncbi:MAG TPA: carbamate kinase, partial [Acidimicrobiales bacterium]|nr:carbamate kinase [Acidimicrobiales bacterium]
VEDQYACLLETCESIARVADAGHQVVITHGNGPQVGFVLRRSELARHELHEVPLSSCIADTQGAIGFQIQEAMNTVQVRHSVRCEAVTVVTQVVVDPADPAFHHPSKPIGSFMDEGTARRREREDGWQIANEGQRGWRRVVPSPRPLAILELGAIRHLVDGGFVVVAVGGGGIPVARGPDGELAAVNAVIDKDYASSLLARELGADCLLISTGVKQVCLAYGTDHEEPLDQLTVETAHRCVAAGEFGEGSMLPKILASLEFVEATGRQAVVCDPANLLEAINGHAGTRIVRE